MFILIILLLLCLPIVSVFIYQHLCGYKLTKMKKAELYFLFIVSSYLFGHITLLIINSQIYYDWLSALINIPSLVGFLNRSILPLISMAIIPFVAFYYKKAADFFIKEEAFDKKPLRKYAHCILALFTILFITFIFSPTYMAIGAEEYIQLSVILTVLLIIAGSSLILGLISFIFRNKYKYAEGLITGILVLCFINAFIFPFQAEILDGRQNFKDVTENIYPFIRNLILLAIFSGFFTIFRKQLRFTAVPFILIALVFTGVNINTMNNRQSVIDENNRDRNEILESAVTLSTESNVIVIVMDMLQGTVAERLFTEYPKFNDSFDGFTVFSRAISSFPFTSYSAGVIQSGVIYSSEESLRINNQTSLENSFLSDMQNLGYDVTMLGEIFNWDGFNHENFKYIGRITNQRPLVVYSSALSASMARLTGYWIDLPIRRVFSVNTEDWEDRNNAVVVDATIESIETTEVLIDRLNTSSDQKKLLYQWNIGTHLPAFVLKDGTFDFNDLNWRRETEQPLLDEAYFFTMQLTRFFEVMKQLDVYDNSLIIIAGDHGTLFSRNSWLEHEIHIKGFNNGDRNYGGLYSVSSYNPVLMVKPPNSRGSTIISHKTAWNGDVRAIVDYYSNETAYITSPIDLITGLRTESPEIGIVYIDGTLPFSQISNYSNDHLIFYVTSLNEISDVFAAHSGAIYD